jgi:hypothetical protein
MIYVHVVYSSSVLTRPCTGYTTTIKIILRTPLKPPQKIVKKPINKSFKKNGLVHDPLISEMSDFFDSKL